MQLDGLPSFQIDRDTAIAYPYGTAPVDVSSRRYYRVHDMNIPAGAVFTILGRLVRGTNSVYTGRYSGSIGESSQLLFESAFNTGTYGNRFGVVGPFIWIIPQEYTTDSEDTDRIYVWANEDVYTANIIGWNLTTNRYSLDTMGVATAATDGIYRVAHELDILDGTIFLCTHIGSSKVAQIVGRLLTPQSDWDENPNLQQAGILNKPPDATATTPDDDEPAIFTREQIRALSPKSDWDATAGTLAEILNKPTGLLPDISKDSLATTGYSITNSGVLIIPTTASTLPIWVSLANLVQQIQAQAADQVQSDWDEEGTSNAAYIQNKPTIIDPTLIAGTGGVAVSWNAGTGVLSISGAATESMLQTMNTRITALENA